MAYQKRETSKSYLQARGLGHSLLGRPLNAADTTREKEFWISLNTWQYLYGLDLIKQRVFFWS